MENNNNVLEIRGLNSYFFTEKGVAPAVDGLDLDIPKGKIIGLVGESGCGKSMTAGIDLSQPAAMPVRPRPAGCSRNLLNVKNAAAAPPARSGPKACMYAPIAGYICPLGPITGSARFWITEPLRN